MNNNTTDAGGGLKFENFAEYQAVVRGTLVVPSPVAEFFYAAYSVVALVGIVGNALVCWIVCSRAGMRTPRNILIANLSSANLLISATLIPFLCIPDINVEWPYGDFTCIFNKLFSSANSYCISFTISAISVDRYIVVKRTGTDSRRLEKRRHALLLSIFIWFLSIAVSLPHVPFSENKKYKGAPHLGFGNYTVLEVCVIKEEIRAAKIWILVQLVVLQYACPLLFVAFFNYKLHKFLKQRQSKRQQLKSARAQMEGRGRGTVQSLRASDGAQHPVLQHPWWKCHPRGWSKTSALLFAMAISYATFWAPFVGVQFLDTFKESAGGDPDVIRYLDITMKLIGNVSVCVNPFLYGYLNTNFRRAFTDLFCINICRRHHEVGVENGDIDRSFSLNFIPELINSPLTAILRIRPSSSMDECVLREQTFTFDDPFSPDNDVFL